MGRAVLHGPVLHGVGHHIGHVQLQMGAQGHGLFQRLVHVFGQAGLHDGVVEHHAAEQVGNVFHTGQLLTAFAENTKAPQTVPRPQRLCCLC